MKFSNTHNQLNDGLNKMELTVISLMISLIASTLIISGWSAVLLHTGKTAGGGPLGLIANTLLNIFK